MADENTTPEPVEAELDARHAEALEEEAARQWALARGLRVNNGIDPGHVEAYRVESAR